MQTRSLVMMGLALFGSAGCQSYFPNGYGGAGAYSAFPPGTYAPSTRGAPTNPTYQPSRANAPSGASMKAEDPLKNGDGARGQKSVPNYKDTGTIPRNLGTPSNDDEETIRRSTSSREQPASRLDGFGDDSDEPLAAFGNDEFSAPQPIKRTAAIDEGQPRNVRRPTRGLFQCDRDDYTYLRGIVSRDPQGKGWLLKYSDDPTDGDMYHGILKIVDHERIDLLREGDTIRVEGTIDATSKDRSSKPVYRVQLLDWVKPRGE
jgi:hypothetical protein